MKETPRETEKNKDEKIRVSTAIEKSLGHISIEGYDNMPRKIKKAAKKQKQGKALTQLELSRLEAVRRQTEIID